MIEPIPKRKILFLLADAILIALSVFLAFAVRFEGLIPERYFLNIGALIVSALVITIPIFYFSRLYSFSWSYVSTTELVSLLKATGLSFLLLTATFFIFREREVFSGFPRSALFITYFFIFIFSGGIRFAKRIYSQIFRSKGFSERERTLIVGAGDAGEQILRGILNFKKGTYLPVGFADDSSVKQGMSIHGLKVLGKIKDIPKIIKENNIVGMIVALPSVGTNVIRDAVKLGREAGLKKIKIAPPIEEIINGQIHIGQLKEVEGADLLHREQVALDLKSIENFIGGKRVLVTGAAGSIGSELCRQIAKFNPATLFLLDQDETGIFNISEELKNKYPKLTVWEIVADICEENRLRKLLLGSMQPQIIFHAAAYKHVPLLELEMPLGNVNEAIKNNILGTDILTRIFQETPMENDKKFIFISTDKAVNPTSVMGATKRMGEMICQMRNKEPGNTKFISVRFGNVLDSRGSVIPTFREQIKCGGPVEVTHPEMKRYFMTISEACLLVMQSAAMGEGGEVFVLDMGKPIKILDLAKEMIKLSGKEPDKDIPIVFTGVRSGEKMFEEFLTAEEGTIATQNQKIFIAKLSEVDSKKLKENLEKVEGLIDGSDKKTITNVLKNIVPTYNPIF